MAPFKLKFRMGSSRSTSQDTDTDSSAGGSHHHQHVISSSTHQTTAGQQQPLLHTQSQRSPTNSATAISTTTLDSIDFPSLGSLTTNDQRNLLPAATNSNSGGGVTNHSYTNPTLIDTRAELSGGCLPQSPPPSYEFVLEENRLASLDKDNNPRHIAASPSNATSLRAASPSNASITSSLHTAIDHLRHRASSPISSANSTHSSRSTSSLNQQRIALLESPAFSYSAMSGAASEEDLLGNIDGSSDPLFAAQSDEYIDHNLDDCSNDNATASTLVGDGSAASAMRRLRINGGTANNQHRRHPNNNDGSFSDSEAADDNYTNNDNNHYPQQQQLANEYYLSNEANNMTDDGDEDSSQWNDDDNQSSYSHQTSVYQEDELSQDTYINNKSTKELYKAVAKKLGITCKMSSQCRCIDCQSNYFDCEYEDNDNQKSDGGLAASTPMFVSEVLHGTTCTIL